MAETGCNHRHGAKGAELAGKLEFMQAEVRRLIYLHNGDSRKGVFRPDIDLDEIRLKPLRLGYVTYKGEFVAHHLWHTARRTPPDDDARNDAARRQSAI